MNKSLVVLVAGLALATSAYGQVPVFNQSSQAYVPLTGATSIPYSSTCTAASQPCFTSQDKK